MDKEERIAELIKELSAIADEMNCYLHIGMGPKGHEEEVRQRYFESYVKELHQEINLLKNDNNKG